MARHGRTFPIGRKVNTGFWMSIYLSVSQSIAKAWGFIIG